MSTFWKRNMSIIILLGILFFYMKFGGGGNDCTLEAGPAGSTTVCDGSSP